MSQSVVWNALGPFARRLPRPVSEHEILRVAATIFGQDQNGLVEAARREALTWTQRRGGKPLPEEAWALRDFECFSGGRNSVGVRIESGAADIWALRADQPDRDIAGRIWTTEIAIVQTERSPSHLSARLLVSTSEATLEIDPHAPGLVRQIADRCGLWRGGYQMSGAAWRIVSSHEAERLIHMLLDPRRDLPVFVLTELEGLAGQARPTLDADALAAASVGLAHVVVLPAFFTWALTNRFGKLRSVFGGAMRVYRPGFAEDGNPYEHRLVVPDQFSADDGLARLTRWLHGFAAKESLLRMRLGTDVLAFTAIRGASLELRQQRFEDEGASDTDQLDAAKARIEALDRQLGEERSLLDYFGGEHQAAIERAEAAEARETVANARVQQLLTQIRVTGGIVDAHVVLPHAWPEFANWCDATLAGRVVLTVAARRALKSASFEDVRRVARSLLWLANACRERRMSGGQGSLSDEPVEDGIRNAHCGADQFDVEWRGGRHVVDWHIKNGGNTRDPKRCLRIYYFWDPESRQIVVADLPAHRRTGAT